MRKRPAFSRFLVVFLFSTLLFLFTPQNLKAQATPAAARKGEISVFGGYAKVWPDYGPFTNHGATFGVDYIHYTHWFVNPSVEFRVKVTSGGGTVDENTWGGGARFEREIKYFHPYADFLISKGTIHYNFQNPTNPHPTGTPYTSDNSIVYSPGLGVDFDVTYHLAARVDYQWEFWNLGNNQTLTPKALTIGVLFRIPFHAF